MSALKTSDTQPLVSVIVPVYKVENYLRNCIESVLGQSYTDWEMILVDDGSPDRCGEICDEYAKGDSRLTVLHTQNAGLSSARNRALDCPPHGEYITFLDSDDFWHKDFLAEMVKLSVNYSADIVQCGFVRGNNNTFPTLKELVNIDSFDNHGIFLSGQANIVMCGKLLRYSLFDDLRMPVGLYNEDDWTTWKLYYRSKTIVTTTRKLYYYTVNPTSITARLTRKPDLRYLNAYNERISFFVNSGEKDLEHCSRLQLCKSLVLIFRNQMLTREERKKIKQLFDENWKELRRSPYIGKVYKTLFIMFYNMPLMASKMAARLHAKK